MVHVEHLSYSFGSQWALKDVSFSLGKGEFLFLTGHSGAGKTTLLRILHGAIPVTRGRVRVAGFNLSRLRKRNIPDLRREVGVVFQDFKILPNRTVFENVALALHIRGTAKNVIERRVRAILRSMGLENKSSVRCEQLSGGEQQRVAIARSMVPNPGLILADEPTGNLDHDLSKHLMGVFSTFHAHGTTIIMATHNLELMAEIPEARVLNLRGGQVVEDRVIDAPPAGTAPGIGPVAPPEAAP